MPRRSASRRNYGSATSIPSRTTSRPSSPHIPQNRYPHGQGQHRRRTRRRRSARPRRNVAGARRRLRRARADHAFLHVALAIRRAKEGLPVIITSGEQEAYPLLPGSRDFDFDDGTLFSILGFSHLSGVSVMGAKWPLDSVEVPFGTSLTLSNEVRGDLRISLAVGRALLLAHPYPGENF